MVVLGERPKWLATISLHCDLFAVYDTKCTPVWVVAMEAPPVQWRAQGSWMFTQWRGSSIHISFQWHCNN
jgi:hypothetical protein